MKSYQDIIYTVWVMALFWSVKHSPYWQCLPVKDGSVLAAHLPLLQTAFTNILALSVLLQCEWGRCGFGAKVCVEPHFHMHSSFLSGPSAAADTALKDFSIAKQPVCPQSFCSSPSSLQAETAAFTSS